MKKKDITGLKYGHLTALSKTDKRIRGGVVWECICDCGSKKELLRSKLINGHTKSCGCSTNIDKSKTMTKHGHSLKGKISKTYRTWQGILERCNNLNHKEYKNYGGRGIKVCDRWLSFSFFLKDMGERPENKTIDRIDNNGNYELSNCRWSTDLEQSNNKRNTHKINDKGVFYTISELSNKHGINRLKLYDRLIRKGLTLEESIYTN